MHTVNGLMINGILVGWVVFSYHVNGALRFKSFNLIITRVLGAFLRTSSIITNERLNRAKSVLERSLDSVVRQEIPIHLDFSRILT